jgi:long-chain acyl-CoA synthetase
MVSRLGETIDDDEARSERPWIAHYELEVPHTVEVPDVTLHGFFERVAGEYPSNVATIFFGEKLTYGQLNEQASRFAAGLQGLGVRPGDRIAIILPNCPQFMVVLFGALKAGAVAVPLNPSCTPGELREQLNDSGVETVVALNTVAPRVHEAIPETPVKRLIVTQIQEYLSPLMSLMLGVKERTEGSALVLQIDEIYRFADLIKNSAIEYMRSETGPDEPAVLLYTAGTTGTPKAATLTHRNLVANACQIYAWAWDTRPEKHDVFLGVMPLFQSYGLTMVMNLAIACAGAIVLAPRFTIKDLLRAITRFRPTVFPALPAIFNAIARHPLSPHYDLRSLRLCISGGAPLRLEVTETFEGMTGARLVESYGLTETSSVTHCNPIYGERRAGSIGLPVPMTEARIVDPESGQALPISELGELTVRGPQVMAGYWGRPGETAAMIRDGWLHTGDLAWQDEDGYFYVVDRKRDVILTGGDSVFPREVEDALFESDKVSEVVVLGVPDKQHGEAVKAYVVLKPDVEATEAELRRFAAERLAGYKVPTRIEFRESLPRNAAGGYSRKDLLGEEIDKSR